MKIAERFRDAAGATMATLLVASCAASGGEEFVPRRDEGDDRGGATGAVCIAVLLVMVKATLVDQQRQQHAVRSPPRRVSANSKAGAISKFVGASQHEVPFGSQMAAGVLVTIPLVILVVVFQRRIVDGLTAGAVK